MKAKSPLLDQFDMKECRNCKLFRGLALVLAVLVLALSAIEALAQDVSLVVVEKVRFEPLTQTVPVIGRLVARKTGNVAARIEGPVEELLVEVGDRVEAGQVIAILNSDITKAERQMAESELGEAEADHKSMIAEEELARTELKRQRGLKKSVAFSQGKFEDAEKAVAVAEAKVKKAEAVIASKKAALARKRLDVAYTTVKAPYAGVVVQRFTEVGAYVSSGDPIVKLIGDRSLEVEADVPFRRITGLTKDRKIEFTLDDGTSHHASVRAVLPTENPLTRTRMVRMTPDFAQIKRPLAEGQSVTVDIPIGENRQILTVHKDAILKRGGGDIVFVVKNNIAQPQIVQLGESVGSRIEVLSGLNEGDVVVIRGNERLRPGAKVQIEKGSS